MSYESPDDTTTVIFRPQALLIRNSRASAYRAKFDQHPYGKGEEFVRIGTMTPMVAVCVQAVNDSVLLLNQNYELLNVCRLRRALVLVAKAKAEALAVHARPVCTAGHPVPRPAVIRMRYYVRRPHPRVRLSRDEIFLRDTYMCQYCGVSGVELTIDHVVPRRLGGQRRWENLVAACRPCNSRKAGKTPPDARMRLRNRPAVPRTPYIHALARFIRTPVDPSWEPYLPARIRHSGRSVAP